MRNGRPQSDGVFININFFALRSKSERKKASIAVLAAASVALRLDVTPHTH